MMGKGETKKCGIYNIYIMSFRVQFTEIMGLLISLPVGFLIHFHSLYVYATCEFATHGIKML